MLRDSALIQEADARYINKVIARDRVDMDRVEPLYSELDALQVIGQMLSLPYHRRQLVAPGVHVTFLDAGHVLGSAIVVLDVEDEGETKRVVFTGDLGRKHVPILRDPEIPTGAQLLITESTYGDRLHEPIEEMDDKLAAVLDRVSSRGGTVVIPSLRARAGPGDHLRAETTSAERTDAEDARLRRLAADREVTEIFKLHPECFDADARALIHGNESPFELDGLHYVSEVEDSKALDASREPAVIISASGMCEAGRVLHHLRATVEDPRNAVVIVGFQAQHTLGRRIVERRPRIKIFGVERELRAEVAVLNGFSAHADQRDLVDSRKRCGITGPLREIILVHGEPDAQRGLTKRLEERHFPTIRSPKPGEVIRF